MTWLQIDPTTHRTIAATIAAGLGSLWWWASRAGQRAKRAAYAAGEDITQQLALLHQQEVERGETCPQCGGRRCYDWRRLGTPCQPQHAPRLTQALGGIGKHQPAVVLRSIRPANWRPAYMLRWKTLAERIGTFPALGVLP